MKNEWDEYAENWNVDPTVNEYASKVIANLQTKVNLKGLTVLDFGCGTGTLTQLMSPEVNKIIAIDPSKEMIKYLNNKSLHNVTPIVDYLSQDVIDKYSVFNEKFDLIVASSVCGFLPSYEDTLPLLKSLLKNKGIFIQWDWLSEDDSSEIGLSEKRVQKAFESNKFADIQITNPFIMESSKGTIPVLMAFGRNS